MNKYQCQVCGAVSYSAASQENLKDNSCLECDGRVEMVEGDKMNADEIMRALKNDAKWVKKISWANALTPGSAEFIAVSERITNAADLIESLQARANQAALNYQQKCRDIAELEAQLAASQRMAQDARNELCLKCGRYRDAHKWACDGCRWKEVPNGL